MVCLESQREISPIGTRISESVPISDDSLRWNCYNAILQRMMNNHYYYYTYYYYSYHYHSILSSILLLSTIWFRCGMSVTQQSGTTVSSDKSEVQPSFNKVSSSSTTVLFLTQSLRLPKQFLEFPFFFFFYFFLFFWYEGYLILNFLIIF